MMIVNVRFDFIVLTPVALLASAGSSTGYRTLTMTAVATMRNQN